MADFAKMQISGRMGRPRFREVGENNILKSFFGVAVNRYRKRRDGTWDQRTVWIDCVAWGRLAQQVKDFGRKGVRVTAEGDFDVDEIKTPEGNRIFKILTLRTLSIFNLEKMPDREDSEGLDDEEDSVAVTSNEGISF